jgi:hypothetical protein
LKYLEKLKNSNNNRLVNKSTTTSNIQNLNNNSVYLDKLVNQTPIGIFKKSELGEAMRLYYYLSPLDLIKHNFSTNVVDKNSTNKTNFNIFNQLTVEELMKHELGSYLTISLQSIVKNSELKQNDSYKLPDSSLLILNENDESNWQTHFASYFNNNLNFEK